MSWVGDRNGGLAKEDILELLSTRSFTKLTYLVLTSPPPGEHHFVSILTLGLGIEVPGVNFQVELEFKPGLDSDGHPAPFKTGEDSGHANE